MRNTKRLYKTISEINKGRNQKNRIGQEGGNKRKIGTKWKKGTKSGRVKVGVTEALRFLNQLLRNPVVSRRTGATVAEDNCSFTVQNSKLQHVVWI